MIHLLNPYFRTLAIPEIVLLAKELLVQVVFESHSMVESLFGGLFSQSTAQDLSPSKPVNHPGQALTTATSFEPTLSMTTQVSC